MDIPILSQLEKIYPNQDTGAAAIRKLVKNQNLIEQGIKEAELIQGPQGPQGIQGPQGNSPYIGSNGNWWVGNIDTGVMADVAINVEKLYEQINVLNGRVYRDFGEINLNYNQNTPFLTLVSGMKDYSILIANTYMPDTTNTYPGVSGTLIIHKGASSRAILDYVEYTGERYSTRISDNVLYGWQQIATTDTTNTIYNRTLAPALSNVIPDTLFIGDEWTGISCVRTDHGTVNAPPNCLIGVRTMKKLNDDNVVVNVENTQNGEKWINTWNGSKWTGWQQIATVTQIQAMIDAAMA